jgi:hypothetical protein
MGSYIQCYLEDMANPGRSSPTMVSKAVRCPSIILKETRTLQDWSQGRMRFGYCARFWLTAEERQKRGKQNS